MKIVWVTVVSASLVFACGQKGQPWWEKGDACPEGGKIDRDGSSVFCLGASGVRHGRFETLAANGTLALLAGEYSAGKRHGTWTQLGADGAVLGRYELASGTGTVSTWHEDGSVATRLDVVDDIRQGSFVKFHPGGVVKAEEGSYRDGKPADTWLFRDGAGAVTREVRYNGGEIWETRHYEGGELTRTELSDAARAVQAAQEAAQAMDGGSGVLGTLRASEGGAFAALTGTGDFSSSLDDANIYGGLLGSEVGEGGFGFGLKGTGAGGGGTGWGTIGTGRYGTIGRGGGGGGGYGTGAGAGRVAAGNAPQVRLSPATATGSLDKDIIRRYIRRQLPRIRRCYDNELVSSPTLSGTVVAQFVISPAGTVRGASVSGIGSASLQRCVRDAITGIRFPSPRGGGIVNVRYPFVMKAADTAEAEPPTTRPEADEGGGAMKRRSKAN